MDETNEYHQQQDDMQFQSESTVQNGNTACSTFHPNPAYAMQEDANIRQEDSFDSENEIDHNEEFPLPPNSNIDDQETNGNDDNLNTFGKRRSMDMIDRANLPLPPQPPGIAVPTPKIPNEEMPLLQASSLNNSQSKGIQEVILLKDDRGKLGLKLKNIKMGVYVMEVTSKSPAELGGIMPGDRILQINGKKVDKYDDAKLHDVLSALNDKPIRMLINKRPLEKTFKVTKDEKGRMGITLRNTKIHKVAKHSPADVIGLSTDFYIMDVNGIKVRGKSEQEIHNLLKDGQSVNVTVMPYYLYEPLMKQIPIR